MISKYKIIKIELSVIYAITALLLISLIGLAGHAVHANSVVRAESMYPDLFCTDTPEIIFPQQKTAYFTFDDGPSHVTEKILDILVEEDVKATFFVCAQHSDDADSSALLCRILDEGHEIGLHSYTHDFGKIYKSADRYLEDLNEINGYVFDATGYHANIMRFPGGSGTVNASPALMKKLIGEIERRGYRFYDWDVDSGDAVTKSSAETLAGKIIKGAKDRDRVIILMHDNRAQKTTPEAVRLAIAGLREQGYRFDKLTACVDPEKHYS